jgi:hypothetical protein
MDPTKDASGQAERPADPKQSEPESTSHNVEQPKKNEQGKDQGKKSSTGEKR